MALTAQQQQQVAAYFANNVYVNQNQTATNGTDVLATAVGTMDTAIAVSVTANNGSISAAASVIGHFTAVQLELLLAYMLMKRAGVI